MRKINWCSIGVYGALAFRCTELSITLAALFTMGLEAAYSVKTVVAFFRHSDLERMFSGRLAAIVLFVLCGVIYLVYDRWVKWRIEKEYEIDRMINYGGIHLTKPRSIIRHTVEIIITLILVGVALTPGVGICYGLYLVTVGSNRAISLILPALLADILLYRLALRICAFAWRRM